MTTARLAAVARQELRTQLRGPLFWVLLLLLLFLTTALNPVAMIPSGESTVAGDRAFANSSHALAQAFAIGSFFAYTFFASLMAGLALIRDDEAGIGELLHATPLTRFEYLAGKLGGAVAALAIALVVHLALTVVVREGPALLGAAAPDHGPFRPLAYLSAILLFAGPGILFVATSAATVAAVTRRAMAVYALPTVLFLYTIGISWNLRPAGLSPVLDRLLIVLDPMAIRWLDRRLFAVDRGLAYFNSAPLELDLLFVVNRLLVLLLPMIGFAIAVRFFRPLAGRGRRSSGARGWSRFHRTSAGSAAAPISPAGGATFRSLGELAMTSTAPRVAAGARAIFRAEIGERFRQPSLYFFCALLMLVVGEVGGSESDLLGGRPLLTAGVLAVRTIPVVTILVCLYLLFSVVEAAERDRATGFADILHASAVPDGALLFGRQLANAAVIATVCAACIAAGLGTLAISAGSRVEVGPLGMVFVLVLAPTFLLWSAFCDAVAAIVGNRHAALAAGLVALIATGACFLSGSMTWASNWPLWGALRWSDLGLFPLNGPALLWNRIAALAGAAAFVALSRWFLVRTERDPSSILGRLRPRRLVRAGLGLVPFLALPLLVQAFLAVRIEEGFQGSRARARADDFWLRNSATWQDEEPPAIEALDLVLDLEPRTRALRAVGTFELRNRTGSEMRWIPFTAGASTTLLAWTVDGVPVPSEDRAGLHVLTLPEVLPPGGSVRVGFEHAATLPRGYTRNGGGTDTYLLPAGVLLGTQRGEFLPWPGFVDRPPAGAAARPVPARYPDGTVPVQRSPVPQRRVAFRTRVEVRIPEPYSVQSVGLRTAEWHADGKVHTVFESDAPVDALNVVAGRWDVLREGPNEVRFHPAHAAGAGAILRTMVAARAFYSDWFRPYPWAALRLSEVPDLETNASSYPTSISFSEGIGFLAGEESDGDLAFSVTAHEVAHQWWGHLLGVADGPGTGLLVEGMANYSTLLLHQAVRGEESRREFARQLERLYLERRRADERPILSTTDDEAGGEAVVSLRGAWVLWMLDRTLGSGEMRAVLRELLDGHLAGERLANPDDLLAAVRHLARDGAEIDRFVADWLEGTALPEIRLRNPRFEKTGSGWRIGATVENVGSGRVEVEIAAMAAGGIEVAGSRRLVRLAPASPVEVEWQLDQRPERLEVDPGVDLLQRNRERAVLDLPPAGV